MPTLSAKVPHGPRPRRAGEGADCKICAPYPLRSKPVLHVVRAVAAAMLVLAQPAHAELKPRWEAGLGVGTLSIPDYRGADHRSSYLFPVPYFVYRGDVVQADRGGVRAALFDGGRLQLNLSLNASVPVSTKDHEARRGMEDLRPAVEFGPTADIRLWHSADSRQRLNLRLPLRAAYTVESSPRHIGWLLAPSLSLNMEDPLGWRGWRLGLQGGPLYGSRAYHRYYYGVRDSEALPGRPAYEASSGYAGTQLTATLSRRFAQTWVGGFVRYDNVAGATFRDSPLVRERDGLSAGLALVWVFGASSEMVQAED